MKHLDILINVLTLLSGFTTALLGFLLYLKYRIKEIRYYAFFILTTTFTVTFTTVYSYMTYYVDTVLYGLWMSLAFILFEIMIVLINYAFTLFALGIINKRFSPVNKVLVGVPCFFILLTVIIPVFSGYGREGSVLPPIVNYFFMVILFSLFLSFVICSIQIARNLASIYNPDLKRALKVLALLIMLFIPVQALVVVFIKEWVWIMLTRNLLYFTVHLVSIIFAAKYFFVEIPSIMEQVEVSDSFLKKFGITSREKEVMELLLSGLSIKEISAKLDRSFKTVNNHIYNIYKKTNVSSKMELLNLVRENRL